MNLMLRLDVQFSQSDILSSITSFCFSSFSDSLTLRLVDKFHRISRCFMFSKHLVSYFYKNSTIVLIYLVILFIYIYFFFCFFVCLGFFWVFFFGGSFFPLKSTWTFTECTLHIMINMYLHVNIFFNINHLWNNCVT